jgi:fumarate reductase subunit D
MKKLGSLLFSFLASFGLTILLLIFMFIVILWGTLYQVDHGLYAAQQKFFDSKIVLADLGPLKVPLPGAYTLMVVLAINLVCGGFIRIRKSKYTAGVLIAHFGIAFMLGSCALTFHFAERGHMILYEGDSSNEFRSFVDWTIEIAKPGAGETVFVIDEDAFSDLKNGKSRVFHSDVLPFDLKLSDYSINAVASRVRPVMPDDVRIVDGYFLASMRPEERAEMNTPGVYAEIVNLETGETSEAILWGQHQRRDENYVGLPLTAEAGGETWLVGLTLKHWALPFKITLDEFIHEKHASSTMAKSFESYITKTEGEQKDSIRIWMNHPLRHDGYTFFQESWGPGNAAPGDPLFSQFAVVRNPGDQGPLYACIIVSVGLLLHFIQKLLAYMRAETKRRTS